MARLSDWEVSTLLTRVLEVAREQAGEADGPAGHRPPADDRGVLRAVRGAAASTSGGATWPPRWPAWRRSAPTRRTCTPPGSPSGSRTSCSSPPCPTSSTEDRIGDLVELFEARCADVVAAQRGRVIKSIGDSVLFVHEDPIAAYEIAEGIITVIGRDPRMPDVRVGLATGLGRAAARRRLRPAGQHGRPAHGVARRNRVIVDAETADLLPGGPVRDPAAAGAAGARLRARRAGRRTPAVIS